MKVGMKKIVIVFFCIVLGLAFIAACDGGSSGGDDNGGGTRVGDVEPNDDPDTSVSMPAQDVTINGTVSSTDFLDYFTFTGDGSTVTITLSMPTGTNVDLGLFESPTSNYNDVVNIEWSNQVGDMDETITYSTTAGYTYLIVVQWWAGTDVSYTLDVDFGGGGGTQVGDNEPNDDPDTSVSMPAQDVTINGTVSSTDRREQMLIYGFTSRRLPTLPILHSQISQ